MPQWRRLQVQPCSRSSLPTVSPALAVDRHAIRVIDALLPLLRVREETGAEDQHNAGDPWRLTPIVIAKQARVALGDQVGAALNADITVTLIGERPGLSSPDSLGAYITWAPRPGRTDAERNCVSNIRPPACRTVWPRLRHRSAKDRLVHPGRPPPQLQRCRLA